MKKLGLIILIISVFTTAANSQNFAQEVNDNNLRINPNLPIKYAPLTNLYSHSNVYKTTNFNRKNRLNNTAIGRGSMETQLSTLWTAVTLNMITADVLSLYIPEGMDEWEDFANGNESNLMLGGAIMYQIPISMVFLSRMLPYKSNRMANIIAAGLMSAAVVAGGDTSPHYIVCAAAEVGCMSLIAWKALKWENPEAQKHDLGLNLNPNTKTYGLKYSYTF
jgi:Family of unknown function (DUF6326)